MTENNDNDLNGKIAEELADEYHSRREALQDLMEMPTVGTGPYGNPQPDTRTADIDGGMLQMTKAYLHTDDVDEIHIQHEGTVYVVEETDGGLELVPEVEIDD